MTTSTISRASIDYDSIKMRQRNTWSSGDYQVIASLIAPVSDRLCAAIDLRAGERVLDVATGSGNTALAAARRLARVTGVDYAPDLLARGRTRAAAEVLPVTFIEGDAEALPVADATYDVVLSTFGSMFAPHQEQAAQELVRACRPGGRIGLANWTPQGWIGEMLRIVGQYVAPPAGLLAPTRWGTEEGLRQLFGDAAADLQVERQNFVWHFASAQQSLDLFRNFYGPVLKAFAALDQTGQEALARDFMEAVKRHNRSEDGTMVVPSEYMQAVVMIR